MEARVQKRMSAREARGFLGLTAGPVAREKDISVSAASSADSADVAGGRAGSRVGAYSEDGGSGVGASRMGEVHVHPSRALWEAQPTPSPTATPSPPVNGNGNSYYHHANKKPPLERGGSSREAGWRRHSSGGGGGGRAGAGGSGGLTVDTFWSPVLPETSPAAPMDSSSLGDHWAWLQQQQQQQSSERTVVSFQPSVYGLSSPSSHHRQFSAPAAITAAGAGVGAGMGMGIAAGGVFGEAIDRPASRGQEYRRQKKRKGGWLSNNSSRNSSNSDNNRNNSTSSSSSSGQLPSASCSSSLMKSGSVEAQLHSAPVADDSTTRRRFWGLQWPLALPRIRRCRSEGQESRDTSPGGGGDGGGGRGGSFGGGGSWTGDGEWGVGEMMPPGSGNEESRLLVSVEGSTELGKGLGGHTAYRLQVTDRAAGEQWVVLRRFRQFEELHGELLHVFSREPDANAYVLPPKEVFGGRHGGVVVKRLKLLKVYLDRLVTCSAAVEHRATSSFLELDPALRGLGAYGRLHGPECVLKEGKLRVKEWKGPHKPVINILEAGLHLIGWTNCHAIVSPGPVFLVYRGREENPAKPFWSLPDRRTVGSQVRVRRVDMWRSDLEKDSTRLFLVSWEDISLLCQVDSDASLESWALSLDESVDLRPQQSELDRAKVDIELKAKEEWTSREEGIWGGL